MKFFAFKVIRSGNKEDSFTIKAKVRLDGKTSRVAFPTEECDLEKILTSKICEKAKRLTSCQSFSLDKEDFVPAFYFYWSIAVNKKLSSGPLKGERIMKEKISLLKKGFL